MRLRVIAPTLLAATLLITLAVLAAGVGGPSVSAANNCETSEVGLSAAEEEFLAAVNAERARLGLGALQTTEALNRAAAWKSADQSSAGGLSHTDSLGREFDVRFRDCGVPGGYIGEIILVGAPSGAQAFAMFRASPPHYAAMTDPGYRYIGISQAGLYWTATLSATGGPPSPPPTAAGTGTPTSTATPTPTWTATPTATATSTATRTPTQAAPAAGVQLQLYAGCNLVSYSGPELAVETALRSLAGVLIDAYRWSPLATPQWQRWAPGAPAYAREFTTFVAGEVYCIRLSGAATWSY